MIYRNLIFAWLALVFSLAPPALAQPVGTVSAARSTMCDWLYENPVQQIKPPDVPACVVTPETFAVGNTSDPIVGDGVTPNTGGWAPVNSSPPIAAIDTVNPSNYITATTPPQGCDPMAVGSNCEAKFRTTVSITGWSYDDPERNYQRPGTAHLHEWSGGCQFGATVTYAKARRINSTLGEGWGGDCSLATGGNGNNTFYWQPALVTCKGGTPAPVTTGTGGVQAVLLTEPNQPRTGCSGGGQYAAISTNTGAYSLYYQSNKNYSTGYQPTPVGFRYVLGYDMDNPNSRINRIVAANAAHTAAGGTGIRYQAAQPGGSAASSNYWQPGNTYPYVMHGWRCNGVSSAVLRNPDGTDPWNGTCTSSNLIEFEAAPADGQCIDGRNLWTPGGYAHAPLPLWDVKKGRFQCGQGWWRIPGLKFVKYYSHNGFAPRTDGTGYGAWELSSDAMAPNPNGGTGVPPGFSWHADWLDGWHLPFRRAWEKVGIGMELLGPGNQRWEWDASSISQTERLHNPISIPAPYVNVVRVMPTRTMTDITAHTGH